MWVLIFELANVFSLDPKTQDTNAVTPGAITPGAGTWGQFGLLGERCGTKKHQQQQINFFHVNLNSRSDSCLQYTSQILCEKYIRALPSDCKEIYQKLGILQFPKKLSTKSPDAL
jgi:hypothetical protein